MKYALVVCRRKIQYKCKPKTTSKLQNSFWDVEIEKEIVKNHQN